MQKPDLVAEVRERHIGADLWFCKQCSEHLPCDAIRLVDELDRLRDDLRVSASAINKQIEVNQGLREALRFYADEENYSEQLQNDGDAVGINWILSDRGQIARAALEGTDSATIDESLSDA